MRNSKLPNTKQSSSWDQLNPKHRLSQLSEQTEWPVFYDVLLLLYAYLGRLLKPICLMVRLSILRHMENLSHEILIQR